MMLELYLSFLGTFGNTVVAFYRQHQVVLNAVVVVYGVVLTLAHRNVLRLESLLLARTGERTMYDARLRLVEQPLTKEELMEFRRSLPVPVLASHWHVGIYPVSEKHIVRILKRKYPGRGSR
jgi:hypothetical protein